MDLSLDAMVRLALDIFEEPRPMPPSWMIAPNFRYAEPLVETAPSVVMHPIPSREADPLRPLQDLKRFL